MDDTPVSRRIQELPIWAAILAALMAGGISSLGFEPVGSIAGPVLGVGLFLLLLQAKPASASFWLGLAFGFGQFAFGLRWIATAFSYQGAMPHWMGIVAVLGLSLVLAIFPAIAAYAARRITGRLVALVLCFAGLFVLMEILRGLVLTGFAWNPLGVAWLQMPGVARLGSLFGANGLTALALLCGGSLAALVGGRGQHGRVALILLFPMLLALGQVAQKLRTPKPSTGPIWLIVQPGVGIEDKNREGGLEDSLTQAVMLTRAALANGPAPAAVVWPEAMVEFPMEELPALRAHLVEGFAPGTLLLTGGVALDRLPSGEVVTARNSLYALASDGKILARYDKSHLVPGGEYLPLRAIAEPLGLSRLVPGTIDFKPGEGPVTWNLPGLPKIAPNICYEIIFPGAVVDSSQRPEMILTVSNDAWFGPSGPPQHHAQARLRAIEEGLPVLRVTPTGISGVIGPRGEMLDVLPQGEAAVKRVQMPGALPPTPFSRLGLWIPAIFALLLLAIGFWGRGSNKAA